MLIVELVELLIMINSISGLRCNIVIDTFVDNLVVTDDGDNMYVDLNGVYSLVNG